MPKKRHNIIALLLIWIFKLIWYILKGIYAALKFLFLGILSLFKNAGKKLHVKNIEIASTKERKYLSELDFKEIEHEQGILENFKHILYENKSTIGLILGARGSGKSALGLRITENVACKTNKRVYAMGFKSLPKWINIISKLEGVDSNSFLLIDESGITFSSRNFMRELNKFLSDLLLISRHKDLSVLFITQNSSNIDVNIIRQIDYLLLKPSSLLQHEFERKKISNIYKEQAKKFSKYKMIKGLTYVYSDPYRGFIENGLPSFWNDKISKSFR